jgi:hypothetical protein
MKNYLLAPVLLAVTIGLASCAIGYKSYDFFTGGGYKDTMLSSNEAKITFRGNEMNTTQETNEYVMKRASELAKEKGFRSFVVVSRSSKMELDYRPGPAAHSVPVPLSEAVVRFTN